MVRRSAVFGVLLLLELAGLLLFVRGFFPVKTSLSGLSKWEDVPAPISNTTALADARPRVGRVVLMVVDAFRADFLFGKRGMHMPFTQGLVNANKTVPYTADASPPTVTLPRIKALTTGSPPNFLDVVRNFDSQYLADDNIVAQMVASNRSVVFYGDDTWLKLFPDHFIRHDGTTSFFVQDTVEVDSNVSRHLDDELKASDWDVLILHYLGLDHIGHLEGPNSHLLPNKLREMDDVVQKIYTSLSATPENESSLPWLFLLCSDHGMNEIGNHGGASLGERSALAVFMSSLFADETGAPVDDRRVDQVDLATTLALLMGTPIPKNSLGVLLPGVLADETSEQGVEGLLRQLQINAHQHYQILLANEDDGTRSQELQLMYSEAISAHREYAAGDTSAEYVSSLYFTFLMENREYCAARFASFDLSSMSFAIAIFLIATVLSMVSWWSYDLTVTSPLAVFTFVMVPLGHAVSLASSSFVEEEHQTCHFVVMTALLARGAQQFVCWLANSHGTNATAKQMVATFFAAVAARVIRGWHQGGDKWRGAADLTTEFITHEDTRAWALPACVVLSSCALACMLVPQIMPRRSWAEAPMCFFAGAGLSLAAAYKLFHSSASPATSLLLARAAYASCFSLVALMVWGRGWRVSVGCVSSIMAIFGILLHKEQNHPLLVMFAAQTMMMKFSHTRSNDVTRDTVIDLLTLTWMGRAAFFALGNSHSVSTIDISGAYTGLSHYQPELVGVLVWLIVFTGPLMFAMNMADFITPRKGSDRLEVVGAFVWTLSAARTLRTLVFSVSVLALRHHLFIWTVFAPKYLYLLAEALFEVFVCCVMIVWALSARRDGNAPLQSPT